MFLGRGDTNQIVVISSLTYEVLNTFGGCTCCDSNALPLGPPPGFQQCGGSCTTACELDRFNYIGGMNFTCCHCLL